VGQLVSQSVAGVHNYRCTRPRYALGYRPHSGGEGSSPAGLVSMARAATELQRYDAPVQFINQVPAGARGARTVAGGGVFVGQGAVGQVVSQSGAGVHNKSLRPLAARVSRDKQCLNAAKY